MIIEKQIGDTIIRVGEPSVNHFTLQNKVKDQPVTIHVAEWGFIKNAVEKMMKAANDIEPI